MDLRSDDEVDMLSNRNSLLVLLSLSLSALVALVAPASRSDATEAFVEHHPSKLEGRLPAKLSEIGIFSDMSTLTPANEVHAYDVRYPLWSDGAVKTRHAFVPGGKAISTTEDGGMNLPVGSVLSKTFSMPTTPEGRKHSKIETRILYHASSGWLVGAYVWNDAGNEATRTDDQDVVLPLRLAGATSDYVVPGRITCLQCHAGVPEFNIGFSLIQVDDATLARLHDEQRFEDEVPFAELRDFPAETDLEREAIGYLAGNCAHCHNPESQNFVGNELDLRPSRAKEALVGAGAVRLLQGDLRTLVKPGKPEESVIYRLFSRTFANDHDPNKFMPPVGNQLVDPHGKKVIAEWIEELGKN